MATWGGTRELVSSRRQWNFPEIDDQSPQAETEDEPAALSPHFRFAVAGVVGLVVVGLAVAAGGVFVQHQSQTEELTAVALTQQAPVETPSSALIVHVSGAVANPGLVELDGSARVFDAIEAAGGATGQAEANRLNLARPVMDGEHIVVPERGQSPHREGFDAGTEPISLSRSSHERLQELPGVGPAIAERIINWRDEHGGFHSVDDALAIPGIGPATLEGFRDQVVP